MRILPSLLFFVIMSTCIISCNKEETLINDIKFELKTELWPNEGGSIIPSSGKYSANIIKSIYARPKPGWVFDRWEGAVSVMTIQRKLLSLQTMQYVLFS